MIFGLVCAIRPYICLKSSDHIKKPISFSQMVQAAITEERIEPVFEAFIHVKLGEASERFKEGFLAYILCIVKVHEDIQGHGHGIILVFIHEFPKRLPISLEAFLNKIIITHLIISTS